jgi:hypothetical protein
MPAYRAEHTLSKTVAEIPPGVADGLVLVDDASPDNTARLARELGIDVHVHPENRGYGANQKTCYTQALKRGADIIVLLHPDYQYEPRAVPLLIAPILAGHADMTFGSRFNGLSNPREGGMPMYRFVGNRVTTILENLMLGTRFTELHSGMRAYTRECLLSLPFLSYSQGFVFDSELLIDAITSRQRVVEVPIPTRYTAESSSIAVGRSMEYIGRSLAYCARKSAVRGRRGKRWPPAGRGRPLAPLDRLAQNRRRNRPWSAAETLGHLAARLNGYAVPGARLRVSGPNDLAALPTPPGWKRAADSELADALVLASSGSGAAISQELRTLSPGVVREGLLALVGAFEARTARPLLEPRGWKLLGVEPVPAQQAIGARQRLVLARRLS